MIFEKEKLNNNIFTDEEVNKYLRDFAVKKLMYLKVQEILIEAFKEIESQNKKVTDVVMNAYFFSHLRKFPSDIFEPMTDYNLLKKGLMGTLWGSATVWVTRLILDNEIKVYSENDESLKKDFPEIAELLKV